MASDSRASATRACGAGPPDEAGAAKRTTTEPARARWNRRYAEGGFAPFPDDPSEWLVEHEALLRELAPGRALDVACGNGRNSLYLARIGFEVDALDVSDFAVERLRSAAAKRELPIAARATDLEREPLPSESYDVVVDVAYLQRDLFPALARSLRPGGAIIFETFSRAHLDEPVVSVNPDYVLEPGELLRAFPDLLVHHYREGVVHRGGPARGAAGIVARRVD